MVKKIILHRFTYIANMESKFGMYETARGKALIQLNSKHY